MIIPFFFFSLGGRRSHIRVPTLLCTMCVFRYFSPQYQQFVMNTQQLFQDFFDRVFHTISSYMFDDCQFQDGELFSAFLRGEFQRIWTIFATRPPPAVSYEDRALPYFRLPPHLSPCGTFLLAPARCQAVSLTGTHCWRRALTPLMLCREHADAWLLPSPLPYDHTSW